MGTPQVIRGVIFDLDGVLVTTDELHYRAWKEIADAEGIHFDRRVNDRLRGVSRMDSLSILLEGAARPYTADRKAELAARKNERYRALVLRMGPEDVLPGVREMLAELRRREIRRAVATSSRNAALLLERTALADAFDAVVSGNDVREAKPAPEIFLLAARRLGLDPAECVVVEDAPAGIEAARRAGMAVFGIGSPEALPGVMRLAPSLAHVAIDALLAVGARDEK